MEREIRIKDISILNRETFSKKDLPSIIRYLDTGSLTKNVIESYQVFNSNLDKIPQRAQRKVLENTILYSTVRPNQEHYGIIETEQTSDIVVSTGFVTIDVVDKSFSPKFIYYLITQKHITDYLQTIAMNAVSSYPSISSNDIGTLKFSIPSLDIQEKITKTLSDLDSKIELNNQINQQLEEMAKTIYDYWFVQFDFPNAEGKPYKSSGGKMVYNKQLKREIPEGWEVKTIEDYCPSTGGFAFKSSWWTDYGIKVVKIKNIQEDNTIDIDDLDKVDLSDKIVDEKFMAAPGDVLIAMTGATIGKYGIVPISDSPIYVNQRVGHFKLADESLSKLPFLINSMHQEYFRESIFAYAGGAAQPNISNAQINKIPLIYPEDKVVDNYNTLLLSSYKMILNNQYENQQLASLRDWLLPMLMNGQVIVGGRLKSVELIE